MGIQMGVSRQGANHYVRMGTKTFLAPRRAAWQPRLNRAFNRACMRKWEG